MNIYISIDEVVESNNPLNYLLELKDRFPDFKATLFAGLFRCSESYLELLESKEWLEVCAYGFYGKPREMEFYNKPRIEIMFSDMEEQYGAYFIKGFKAPNFAFTEITYEVCQEKGYWINMHPYHKKPFPTGMQYYKFNKDVDGFEFAGHSDNNSYDKKGINQSFNLLVQTLEHIDDKQFKFCSENLKINV